jgi:hypothetical protein
MTQSSNHDHQSKTPSKIHFRKQAMFSKKYFLKTNLSPEESSKKISRLLKTNDVWDISISWKKFKMERPHNYSGKTDEYQFRIKPDGYWLTPLFIKGVIEENLSKTTIQLTIKPTLSFYIVTSLMTILLLFFMILFVVKNLSWNLRMLIPVGISLIPLSIPI